MKNLAVAIVFLVIIAFLFKYGIDGWLEEKERHNKFLEDYIDENGLQNIIKIDNPIAEEEPDPTDPDNPDTESQEEQPVVVSANGVAPSSLPSDPNNTPKYLNIEKVSEAVKIIFTDWVLGENKEFKKDLKTRSQGEFVKEYINDTLGEQIRLQFGLSDKKSGLYKYYKDKGVKTAQDMSDRILVQLYKYSKKELKLVK